MISELPHFERKENDWGENKIWYSIYSNEKGVKYIHKKTFAELSEYLFYLSNDL